MIKFLGIFLVSSAALSAPYQLFCQYYVTQNIPFCDVTLSVLENGELASTALINHQGSVHKTQIRPVDLEPGQLFHLWLDADKPGQEIEMVVEEEMNSENQWPSALTNHEAPFAKKMVGVCRIKS